MSGTPRGILPVQELRRLIDEGAIRAASPLQAAQLQPNSLDLRLGRVAHRVRSSFLPGEAGVDAKLARYEWYRFAIPEDEGAILERDHVYLVELEESLDLPREISGRGNPKSSTGRLDVFTRIVTEEAVSFDAIPRGYRGRLFIEIVPRSFAIRVRPGDTLAQLRLSRGSAELDEAALTELVGAGIVRDERGELMPFEDLRVGPRGFHLSVSLPDREGTIGYRARKNAPPVDLRAPGTLPVREYWERLDGRLDVPVILEPDEFYIFSSRERLSIPPGVCAEMAPYDAGSGEMRTHYAGFFDSGFGWGTGEPAAVVLEVRNRDVPFLIEHGQPLFRLEPLKNLAEPESLYGQDLRSNYQSQGLRLAKQFVQD